MSIKNLGQPKRIKTADLIDRPITINQVQEIGDTRFGTKKNYLRIQAEGENNGVRERYSFNSSSGAIKKQLNDKQLPLAVTIRRAKTQKGNYYFWLE